LDGASSGGTKAVTLVYEVEAVVPVTGPGFGEVVPDEGYAGRELGGEELGLEIDTDVGIVGCGYGRLEVTEPRACKPVQRTPSVTNRWLRMHRLNRRRGLLVFLEIYRQRLRSPGSAVLALRDPREPK
jgi:hypothetical protein